jgi:hypothetical protein
MFSIQTFEYLNQLYIVLGLFDRVFVRSSFAQEDTLHVDRSHFSEKSRLPANSRSECS